MSTPVWMSLCICPCPPIIIFFANLCRNWLNKSLLKNLSIFQQNVVLSMCHYCLFFVFWLAGCFKVHSPWLDAPNRVSYNVATSSQQLPWRYRASWRSWRSLWRRRCHWRRRRAASWNTGESEREAVRTAVNENNQLPFSLGPGCTDAHAKFKLWFLICHWGCKVRKPFWC